MMKSCLRGTLTTTLARAFRGTPCGVPAQRNVAGYAEQEAAKTSVGRNLLLGVDYTQDSQYAVQWTVDNIYRFGDTLHLMHCIDIPMAPPATEVYSAATSLTGPEKPPDLPPQVEAELLNTARDKITSLYSRQLEAASVPYHVKLVIDEGIAFGGGVAEKVCQVAEQLNAAAVVVASQGKSVYKEFLVGSVSNFLVHQCPRPVLVLHAPPDVRVPLTAVLPYVTLAVVGNSSALGTDFHTARVSIAEGSQRPACASIATSFEDKPAHASAAGTRHIAMAVDSSTESERIAAWTAENVARHGDVIHALHVVPAMLPRDSYSAHDGGVIVYAGPLPDLEELLLRQDNMKEEMSRRFKRLFDPHGCSWSCQCPCGYGRDSNVYIPYDRQVFQSGITCKVEMICEDIDNPLESVASAICKRTDELDAACLVAASGHKGLLAELFMGSVTAYCTHNCRAPVLVLT